MTCDQQTIRVTSTYSSSNLSHTSPYPAVYTASRSRGVYGLTISHRLSTVYIVSRCPTEFLPCIRFRDIQQTCHGFPRRCIRLDGIPPTYHGTPQTCQSIPRCRVSHRLLTVSHRMATASHGIPPYSHGIPPYCHGIPRCSTVSQSIPRCLNDVPRYLTASHQPAVSFVLYTYSHIYSSSSPLSPRPLALKKQDTLGNQFAAPIARELFYFHTILPWKCTRTPLLSCEIESFVETHDCIFY